LVPVYPPVAPRSRPLPGADRFAMPRPGAADRFAEDPRTRGRVLGGQYRVLKKIGSGAFSDVYCCEDQLVRGKGKVALKKLNLSNRAELAACRKEVEAMKSVEHVRLPLLSALRSAAG